MHARIVSASFSRRSKGEQIMTASWMGATDFESAFNPQATGESQQFAAFGLHVEIAQRTRVEFRRNPIDPAEARPLPAAENGVIGGVVAPLPELGTDFPVALHKFRASISGRPMRIASDFDSIP